ncbi:glycosyltransferase [Ferruginivarius sediminum]|uniref:Glycosyltransferase n=1 Tax=Ferruginivarius sediminum TaxID=2661937 RepID=A0A369T4G3_9PROT|nr:glycosyltransferase [Ferruginivarius sediminum]RDD60128.1 glycosyltransferase [Ferruginivarius sediminum]
MESKRPHVCIVAYKDLRHNTRVLRQARILSLRGNAVSVIALGMPPQVELERCGVANAITITGAMWHRDWLLAVGSRLWKVAPTRMHEFLELSLLGWRASRLAVRGKLRLQCFAQAVLRANCADTPFDVVQAHDEHALIAACLLAEKSGARLIYDAVEMTHEPEYWRHEPVAVRVIRSAEMAIERRILRDLDGAVTVNDSLADHFERTIGGMRPLVLRNCREFEPEAHDRKIRVDLGLSDADRLLVFINSIWPGEGAEVLLHALAQLPGRVHLAFLGPEGKTGYISDLMKLAEHLQVQSRVHMLPVCAPTEMIGYMSGADLGVIPRQAHHQNMVYSLPNRIFELIMARLPIAAASLPEIARLVSEYDIGQVFDETNSAAMAETIESMLETETLSHFKKSVQSAAAELCWEREGAHYAKYIESMADGVQNSAKR